MKNNLFARLIATQDITPTYICFMQNSFAQKINKHFSLLLFVVLAANSLALFNDILEPDGALYASIAKYIVTKNDWINLYAYGTDWLDKPHLPFWFSALGYKIFGINAFAYKLPSFVCFLLGVLYTYKFSIKLFSKELAQLATIIYASSLHIILSNFDVRAEGYLTAFIIASIYHFFCASKTNGLKHIAIAALYAAFAIMTKGIFVLITIVSGFVVYWIASKQWKEFIHPKWYLFILFCLVFITPELYCLYQQFDLHPEKLVFGLHNVSGIKFFFWDSQFGRFFNNGPIQGSGDVFFFLHTTLWAFLPWSIFLFLIAWYKLKKIKKYRVSESIILYGGALITFLLFSVSKFQLPHYIVIIFPLLSIIVAKYLLEHNNLKTLKIASSIQVLNYVVLIIAIALTYVFFKLDKPIIVVITIVAFTQFFYRFNKENSLHNILLKGVVFSVLLALFLNIFFYPKLMLYQAGMVAGKWQQQNLPNQKISMYRCNVFSLDFYGNTEMKRENEISSLLAQNEKPVIFTTKGELEKLNTDSFKIINQKSFPYFHISELNATFFNHKTRYQSLDTFIIATVYKKY